MASRNFAHEIDGSDVVRKTRMLMMSILLMVLMKRAGEGIVGETVDWQRQQISGAKSKKLRPYLYSLARFSLFSTSRSSSYHRHCY